MHTDHDTALTRNGVRAAGIAEDSPTDPTVVLSHNDVESCLAVRALLTGLVRHPVPLQVILQVLERRHTKLNTVNLTL